MKRFVLALLALLLLTARPVSAQVSDVLPTSQLQWDITDTTAATVQAYVYSAYVDAAKGPPLAGVACVVSPAVPIVATNFTCTAPVPAALLTVGTHQLALTATAGGTETVQSNVIAVTVVPAAPTVTTLVQTGTLPSATFTATVTGGAGVPTGTLVFKDGGVVRQTGVLNASGQAAWTSVLTVGTHVVTAEYSGGGLNWANSVSAPLSASVSLGVPSGLRIIR